jgi:hypothetical protein
LSCEVIRARKQIGERLEEVLADSNIVLLLLPRGELLLEI